MLVDSVWAGKIKISCCWMFRNCELVSAFYGMICMMLLVIFVLLLLLRVFWYIKNKILLLTQHHIALLILANFLTAKPVVYLVQCPLIWTNTLDKKGVLTNIIVNIGLCIKCNMCKKLDQVIRSNFKVHVCVFKVF